MLPDSELVHASEDDWVEDETVLQPVVFQVILADPIDSVLLNASFLLGLEADLEALAVPHALMQDCLAHDFFPDLPKSICVEVTLL